MSYGLRVWDQLGQLGTDSSDIVGLCLFADVLATIPFPYESVVIEDVDDRPMMVIWRQVGGSRWIPAVIGGPYASYNSTTKELTITNATGATGGAFFLAMSW